MTVKVWGRRVLLGAGLVLALADLGAWVYFYLNPPAPSGFGTAVGLVAAVAVALAALGGLSDLVGAPPTEPWDGEDHL
ncbi:MAG: hypothetical protein ACUVXG_06155 [Anaerolineae bacterium]